MTPHLGWTAERRRAAVKLFIEQRGRLEWPSGLGVAAAVLAVEIVASDKTLMQRFPSATRSGLYISLTATAAALLGFVLAGLAILIALPSGERLTQLQKNEDWSRVPGTFLRAAVGLLALLILATVALAADIASVPRLYFEAPLAGVLIVTVERVVASLVVLEAVIAVKAAEHQDEKEISDP